ncbi:hypothetical protein BC830DRAFT_1094208 [Chytriomyces sp. MP71]|nr:hypothetical protein BC830DRAFT_1094208 [Chytriomyces sp. MP71]
MAPYPSGILRKMKPATREMDAENRLMIIPGTPGATPAAPVYIRPTHDFAPSAHVTPAFMASAVLLSMTLHSGVQAIATKTMTTMEASPIAYTTTLPSISTTSVQYNTSMLSPSASPATAQSVTSLTFSIGNQPSKQLPYTSINPNSVKPASASPPSSQMANPPSFFDSMQVVLQKLVVNKLLLGITIGLLAIVLLIAIILIVRCCRRRAASVQNNGADMLPVRKRQDSIVALIRAEETDPDEAPVPIPVPPISETGGKVEAQASSSPAKSRLIYGNAAFGGRKWPVAKAIGGRWIWIGTNILVFKGTTDFEDEITVIKSLKMAEAVWEMEEEKGYVNEDFEQAWQTLLEML